jgi:hypothetical protein
MTNEADLTEDQEFDGIHAALGWGYAKVSSTQPIECNDSDAEDD